MSIQKTTRTPLGEMIFNFRGLNVMIDRDLAMIYEVETKVLNQAVKRNPNRFPASFRFELTEEEKSELVTNCDRFQTMKHSTAKPHVFTEQGVAMLSAVLRSEQAVKTSIEIMEAFVNTRRLLNHNANVLGQIQVLRQHHEQLALNTEERFNQVFDAIGSKSLPPAEGVFFDGQVFDAYEFVSDLIRSARSTIRLIDNYVDDTVLTLLLKRVEGVEVLIYTNNLGKDLKLDIEKHNAQYPKISVSHISDVHDRFLIIDDERLYHIGASIKDLGRKWFAFSRMDSQLKPILEKLLGA